MTPARIQSLTWPLVYGGMIAATIGWFVAAGSAAIGGVLMVGGGVLVVIGIVLIWVRSRSPQ